MRVSATVLFLTGVACLQPAWAASQTITFGTLASIPLSTATFMVAATASSGLPVSFASTTPAVCTVSGNTVTVLALGTCSIVASQAGNGSFAAATSVAQSFNVTSGPQAAEVGVFRQGFAWLLDANGNRQYDGTGPGLDYFYYNFVAAQTGDIPVVGDWSGSGTTKIGIYRPSTGQWFLDYNGNGVFDAGDKTYSFGGIAGDKPVVGDWSGSGFAKIGIFRSGYFWLLDYNGDGMFDNGDQAFAFGGVPGDVPVAGDWTGNGVAKVGVVRPFFPGGTPAFWILDANNDHVIDPGDLVFAFGGIAGDVPVVGDWNGTGFAKAGMYRQGFFWVIDNNGSAPTVLGSSQLVAFPFGGVAGDIPVTGAWAPGTASFNASNITGTIYGLYPASGPYAAQNGGNSTSGPVGCSPLLTAAAFTTSFNILPGAQPFQVVAQGTLGGGISANIYINPALNTWLATYTVPTASEQYGDFSQTNLTTADFLNNGLQFPGNIVPLSRIDPLTLTASGYLPLPNFSQVGISANGSWIASGTLPATGPFSTTLITGQSASLPSGYTSFGGFAGLANAGGGARVVTFQLYVDGQLIATAPVPYTVQ